MMISNIALETKKIELIQWLSTTYDLGVLDKVQEIMLSERNKDWWIDTSNIERQSIEKGINDASSDKLKLHTKARDIYGKWL